MIKFVGQFNDFAKITASLGFYGGWKRKRERYTYRLSTKAAVLHWYLETGQIDFIAAGREAYECVIWLIRFLKCLHALGDRRVQFCESVESDSCRKSKGRKRLKSAKGKRVDSAD